MWLQFKYWLGVLLYLPTLPLLIWQGKRLKKKFPRVPAAQNPSGSFGAGDRTISVVGLGESTMAGVGVADHKDGITGQFSQFLQEHTQAKVDWQVFAKSGYTALKTNQHLLPKFPEEAPDILLIGLAANNVFALNSPLRWRREMEDLLISISAKWPETKMVLLNLPPVEKFPGLTGLMRSIFGQLINLYHPVNLKLANTFELLWYCEKRVNIKEWKGLVENANKLADFFSDGVHPSNKTYAAWARETLNLVLEQGILEDSLG